MKSSRHLLLVAVLFFAQLLAGMHAIEHVAANEEALPTHLCVLCLAAHDLGAALPSLAALLPPALPSAVPAVAPMQARTAWPVPLARQGAPPRA